MPVPVVHACSPAKGDVGTEVTLFNKYYGMQAFMALRSSVHVYFGEQLVPCIWKNEMDETGARYCALVCRAPSMPVSGCGRAKIHFPGEVAKCWFEYEASSSIKDLLGELRIR